MYHFGESSRERRLRKTFEREADVKRPFSGFYHRYFEGWSERTTPKENGRGQRIIREYVGDYYQRKCREREWVAIKALYVLLFLSAAALYLYGIGRSTQFNDAWYVTLPGLLSLIPLLLLLAKIAGCAIAPRTLKLYDYKSVFGQVFRYCAIAAGMQVVTAFMMLLYAIAHPQTKPVTASILLSFAAACILTTVGLLERNAKYERIANPKQPQKGSLTHMEE